ncbi:MAG: YicC family protein [Candidatus Hydrogenedentes bacterium]|nr:YicC family protein [Candidatus Hydrogenedentota bacterium]
MTGFGKATCDLEGEVVSAELSSVNHRYFDCGMRLPNGWSSLEPVAKQTLKKWIDRGKVNVLVSRKRARGTEHPVKLDTDVAKQYVEASQQLAAMLGTQEALSLNVLAQLEGVFGEEENEEDLAAAEETLVRVLTEAAQHLNAMRETEGAALAADIRHRLGLIREALAAVEERLPELNARHETRLRERINELSTDISVTEERIGIEVALLAEKGDVTEEVIRLKTHLDHVEEVLGTDGSIGRRLDFLAQEIQREINTLGVKTRDADVASYVLDMKSELEKIREQVQNIE